MNETGKVTFQATGFAPDVVTADVQSWGALTSVLGPDSIENWSLTKLETFHVPADADRSSVQAPVSDLHRGGVQWVATYTRTAD